MRNKLFKLTLKTFDILLSFKLTNQIIIRTIDLIEKKLIFSKL